MNSRSFVVRIVKPSPEPALPKKIFQGKIKKIRSHKLSKTLNILVGSGIGFFAGMAIFLMLKFIGINFGGLESSIIIGLPAALGILTSLVIF